MGGLSDKRMGMVILSSLFLLLMVEIAMAVPANDPNSNCGCSTKSEGQPSGLSAEKIINCNDIMSGFEKGEQRVKVIVNLAEPAETKARTDWHSKHSLKLLQDEIKATQVPVLSALSEGEFKLRYRFDNQAGFSGEVTLQGLEKLKNDPRVISVEPVYLLEPHLRQGIPLMHADTYRSSYNGAGAAIAICDTGIDYRHSMLGKGGFPNSKVIGGYDYGDNDADPMPDSSQAHGTCCAGIAAGDLGDVGDYIGGAAYNAKLYALKITAGSSGSATSDAMVAAWDWCVTHQNDDPAHPILAISTSFGGGRNYSTCDNSIPSMTQAANSAVAAGITVLVSSGNDGYCDSIAWPACISSVISVGAVYDATLGNIGFCTDSASCTGQSYPSCSSKWACFNNPSAADMVTCYSNTASFLNLLAPSHDAYTTDIVGSGGYDSGDYYAEFGGTSAACPYTAGAVACLQSAAKTIRGSYLSPSEVRTILTSTGDNITDGKVAIIKPRINLERAINNLLIGSPPTANSINVTTPLNTAITIAFQATDDGLPNPPSDLNYIITSLPTNGSLSDPNGGGIGVVPYTLIGGGNQVIYTPATGYSGTDNFTFKANDGGAPPYGGDSNPANVSVSITSPGFTIFLTESFETPFVNGAPVGWSRSFQSKTVDWIRNNGDHRNDGSHGGVYNALLYASNRSNHETYLITPAINFVSGTQNATLEFWHKQAFWSPNQDTLAVYYKIGVGGSWTQLASYTTDVSSWTKRTISLPNPGTNYYIGFLGNAKYGYGVCIDDVKVTGIILQLWTLTISSTPGGHTEPNEGDHQFSNGTVVGINAIPDLHYHFVNWTGTGVTAGKVADANSAGTTVTMDANYTVQANFGITQFTIHASAGANGMVEPTSVVVNYGSNQYFNAIPNIGYEVNEWFLDGNSVQQGGTTYTLSNITAAHTVHVAFKILTYTVTASAGANGSISPNGDITKDYGSSQVFNAIPATGYDVNTWYVDGNSVQSGGTTYTLPSITATHAVAVSFSQIILSISGYVVELDGNTPVAGVLVSTGDINAVTEANGFYQLPVEYGWSGVVTPQKEGYVFEPNSDTYADVNNDFNDANYTAALKTFVLAGHVFKTDYITPINDVNVAAKNGGGPWTSRYGGGATIADANGYYEVIVDYNWSGVVVPTKYAYVFEPNGRYYTDVNQDYVAGQDYTGILLTFRIVGYIKNGCDVPVEGVSVDANNGGGSAVTDANGFYEVWVDYEWSGVVTPDKKYYTFEPNWTNYVDVLADLADQNYVAFNIYDFDCDGAIGLGDLTLFAGNWLMTGPGISGDFNADEFVNFVDFACFAAVW